jgi:hypothetical protein
MIGGICPSILLSEQNFGGTHCLQLATDGLEFNVHMSHAYNGLPLVCYELFDCGVGKKVCCLKESSNPIDLSM